MHVLRVTFYVNFAQPTDEYPDRAIPNSAPVLGRAEANFKYNLDIDALVDDIMAPLTLNLRTSAILIKINDTSSLEEEISYIVLVRV